MPTFTKVKQEIRSFQGVNLRKDRLDLADEELAKAVNADLHNFPGSIVLRNGRSKLYTTALSDTTIRRISKINSMRYQVAGTTVYRDQTSVLTGLSSNLITTIIPFRPLNDTTIWAFIADDGLMRKDDGTNVRTWGIAAPTATATAAAQGSGGSMSAGDYLFKFTYVRKDGSNVAHESSPSPATAAETAVASDSIDLSGMTASSDGQVTHKRIYRTVANGAVYLYDQEIADTATTATSSQADSALGAVLEDDNDVPPDASWAVSHQEHVFLCRDASNPHYLWYSKRFRPESFPSGNYIEVGNADDAVQCAVSAAGLMGVFTRLTKYRIIGNALTGFVPVEALSRRGTPCPNATIAGEQGIIFPAKDGIYVTNLSTPDVNFAWDILPLFFGETVNGLDPINWNQSNTLAAASYKNRYYLSYPSGTNTNPDMVAVFSEHTKKWYFFDHPMRSFFVEEDNDYLTGGSTDGFVYILETGSGDDGSGVALDVETKDYVGVERSADVRKLFRYFKVDADCGSATLTANFYVDGVLKQASSVTGNRTKLLLPLPEECFGYTWRVGFSYTGIVKIKIYGVSAIYLPFEES